MKTKLLFTLAISLAVISANASPQYHLAPVNNVASEQYEITVNDTARGHRWNPFSKERAPKAKDGSFHVTCTVTENTEWNPWDIVAYDNEHNTYYGLYNDMDLPMGTYDFVACFGHRSSTTITGEDYMGLVILENIAVSEDMTLEFDPTTAVNHLHFVPKLKNGEDFRMRHVQYYPGPTIVLEEGNLDCSSIIVAFIAGTNDWNYQLAMTYTAEIQETEYGTYDPTASFNLYVNDVSDNINLGLTAIIFGNGDVGTYVITSEQQGSTPGDLVNDHNNYVEETLNATWTSMGSNTPYLIQQNGLYVHPYGLQFAMVGGYTYYEPHFFALSQNDPSLWGISYSNNGQESTYFNALIAPTLTEVYREDNTFYGINNIGSFTLFSGNQQTQLGCIIDDLLPVPYINAVPHYFELPGFELYTALSTDNLEMNFTTSPSLIATIYDDGVTPVFSVDFTGRTCESRYSDRIFMNLQATNKGEVIANSLKELNEWLVSNNSADGALEINITNNNCLIDEQEVVNTAIIQTDLTREDHYPPTLLMVQFRNTEGKITSTFNEGEIRLSAVDINYIQAEENFSSDAPASVVCEYAPTGTDDYTEIELTQLTNYVDDTIFKANFYSPISFESGDGWYDLRITVTDNAGNSQTQKISKAFNITESTAINEITISDEPSDYDGPCVYYDLMGRQVANPSSTGIYIEKRGKTVRKILVK